MNCEHQIMREIENKIVVGLPRGEVESFLRSIAADFSYHDKNELKLTRDEDANMFEAKIVVVANLPSKSDQLIQSSELMTIGFGEDALVQAMSCKKIYAGP